MYFLKHINLATLRINPAHNKASPNYCFRFGLKELNPYCLSLQVNLIQRQHELMLIVTLILC